jgi:hypothetical protein
VASVAASVVIMSTRSISPADTGETPAHCPSTGV